MNDVQIRANFHRKKLRWHHTSGDSLVIDELGLNHGRSRADIAVVNGHLVGYEIKSDSDSLDRLAEQIKSYNAVFDWAFIIVGERHVKSIEKYVPDWWGLILSVTGRRGAVNFKTLRKGRRNHNIDPISVARLLWRSEAAEVLRQRGLPKKSLRQPRAALYEQLVEILSNRELRQTIRESFKKRKNWRYLG
jgi:hypothetical protein